LLIPVATWFTLQKPCLALEEFTLQTTVDIWSYSYLLEVPISTYSPSSLRIVGSKVFLIAASFKYALSTVRSIPWRHTTNWKDVVGSDHGQFYVHFCDTDCTAFGYMDKCWISGSLEMVIA
jgi:hypothetical protein